VALRGLTLAKLTPALRQKYNVDANVDGVIVTGVDAQSVAAERVMPGDVIMQTNQGVVAAPDDVVRNLDRAAKDGRKTILLLLKKASGELRFVALPLG
jgi:serine protease Do